MLRFLALLALIPFLFIRSLITRIRLWLSSGSKQGGRVSIERVKAEGSDLRALMERRQPVIIEGLTEQLDLSHSAELASLKAASENSEKLFPVEVYDGANPYFLYTGDYGKQWLHTETMNLKQFLAAMFDTNTFDEQAVYKLFHASQLEGATDQVLDEMVSALSGKGETEPEKQVSGIWIGSKGVVTPLHFDAWPGLLFQMHGSKRVKLFAPNDVPDLYFLSPFAVGKRWSNLPGRSGDADPAEFPRLSSTTSYEGVLETGDVLLIPSYWPHEAEALEPNISVPFRFRVPWTSHLSPWFLRPACELFHGHYLKSKT